MDRSRSCFRAAQLAALHAAVAALLAACGAELAAPPAAPRSGGAGATGRSAAAAAAGPVCGTGAHPGHAAAGLGCAVCHPCGGESSFARPYTYPKGTTSANGTLTLGSGTTPTTCSVGCHAPGSTPTPIAWTTPGPLACTSCHAPSALPTIHPVVDASATRADCMVCHVVGNHGSGTVTLVNHPAGWSDPADPGFHAYAADRGLQPCQQCHLQDLGGGVTGFSCAQCHDRTDASGNPIPWRTRCTMCHGGTANATGAPPRAIWGQGGDPVRVGAHTAHVTGSAMAPPFDCGVCHVKPADALAAGHVDVVTGTPFASVAFSGLATQGGLTPAWSREAATCSATWCHGASLGGGSNKAPVWTTVDGSQAACGTCHGLPPPPPHYAVAGVRAACSPCHGQTIDAAGGFIPPGQGGKHLDGTVQVTMTHPEGWMNPASAAFHAVSANRGLAYCGSCHGADLGGGIVGIACAGCHSPGGIANDFGSCVACHGGTDNTLGAPPRATWGNANPLAVGAHTSHVEGSHALALPVGCTSCHPNVQGVLTPGHVDGAVSVTGYSGTDPSLAAVVGDPGFDPSTGTCATSYCHGATLQGGSNRTPSWAVLDGSQEACGTCHGNPPGTGRHWDHVIALGLRCWGCHTGLWPLDYNVAEHVNGLKDLSPGGSRYGTFTDWSPTAAGRGTLRGTAGACHRRSYYWTGSPGPGQPGCW